MNSIECPYTLITNKFDAGVSHGSDKDKDILFFVQVTENSYALKDKIRSGEISIIKINNIYFLKF